MSLAAFQIVARTGYNGGVTRHELMDPGLVEVFAVRDGVRDVGLGDNVHRPAGRGIQDRERARVGMLH